MVLLNSMSFNYQGTPWSWENTLNWRQCPRASVTSEAIWRRRCWRCWRLVGLSAGRPVTVDSRLGSSAGRSWRHRQAEHMHQSLSHRVGVMYCVSGISRVLLFSLADPSIKIHRHHLTSTTTAINYIQHTFLVSRLW